MKPHYSEAELLETYYTQPGESMPVMMHLADCGECAVRYEALDRKLREAAACDTERAETFWTRQRMSIMRRVARQARNGRTATPRLRVAAALTLVAVLSGFAAWRAASPRASGNQAPPVVSRSVTTSAAVEPLTQKQTSTVTQTNDVWQSDELKDFHTVVDWESWVQQPQKGDQL